MEDDLEIIKCSKCGEEFNIWEMSYIGSPDRLSETCSPFMELEYICYECDEES
jgi:DNA-directed RNA polymerase subunit RPC12/RpoP